MKESKVKPDDPYADIEYNDVIRLIDPHTGEYTDIPIRDGKAAAHKRPPGEQSIIETMFTRKDKIFEKLASAPIPETENTLEPSVSSIIFELKQGKIYSKGQRTSDGFIVFQESRIRTQVAPSCPKHAKKARELHASVIDSNGTLLADIILRSPAEAACFVTGTSINAREAWKTVDGKTLKDIENIEAGQV